MFVRPKLLLPMLEELPLRPRLLPKMLLLEDHLLEPKLLLILPPMRLL
jgi:hypothetical protein